MYFSNNLGSESIPWSASSRARWREARAFRADEVLRSTFLVALSGYAQAEDIERAHAAGFDEHLAKPPTIARLKRIFAACAPPARR